FTGAEIDHQKRAGLWMEAETQDKTGRGVDRQGAEQAPILIEDENLFRTDERGDIDVAVGRDGEALGQRAPVRQHREKLRYVTVECRRRVGLRKEYYKTRTEHGGDLHARGQSTHDVSPLLDINRRAFGSNKSSIQKASERIPVPRNREGAPPGL